MKTYIVIVAIVVSVFTLLFAHRYETRITDQLKAQQQRHRENEIALLSVIHHMATNHGLTNFFTPVYYSNSNWPTAVSIKSNRIQIVIE